MWPLLLSVLESPDKVAEQLEARPFPYFLALVLLGLATLWGALSTVVWWAARSQARLHEQNYRREMERNGDLKRERDATRDELARERHEHTKLTIELVATARGLARLKEDLDDEVLELAEKKAKRGLSK